MPKGRTRATSTPGTVPDGRENDPPVASRRVRGATVTEPVRPNNLPQEPSTFVGRERELAGATKLLSGTRLLTLTGSWGCGKTRLALWVAREAVRALPTARGGWGSVPVETVTNRPAGRRPRSEPLARG